MASAIFVGVDYPDRRGDGCALAGEEGQFDGCTQAGFSASVDAFTRQK